MKGGSTLFQNYFLSSYSLDIEFKLSTYINGLMLIAYKLWNDPA